MIDLIRPFLARIVASVIGALAAWAAGKYGVVVPDELKGQLTETIVAVMMFVFGLVYAVTHRLISARFNPADAATSALVEQGKTNQHVIAARKSR